MSDLIEVHLAHLRAGGCADSTMDARRRLLYDADGWLPYGLEQADEDEIAAYLGYDEWSRWTRYTYWKHLNGFYVWAVKLRHLTSNPVESLPRPPAGEAIPNPVTDAELADALRLSPDYPWKCAIMLAAYAGLRDCELVVTRRQDVTEESVRVRNGKGGRDAYIPTHPALWAFVRDRGPGLLVRGARGAILTAQAIASRQHKHWRRIGMPEVHMHRFRHWYGTALLKAGADLRTVQELMRHKSIVSTQGYTQVVDEQRRLAICTLPVLTTGPQLGTTAA
jgi:integrase